MSTAPARGLLIAGALCAATTQAAVGFALDLGQATVSGPDASSVGYIEGDGLAYGARVIYGVERVDLELGYRKLPEATGQTTLACPGGCGPLPPVPIDALDAWSFAVALRPFGSADRFSIMLGLSLLKGGADDATEPMLGLRYTALRREGFELALTAEAMASARVLGVALVFGR